MEWVKFLPSVFLHFWINLFLRITKKLLVRLSAISGYPERYDLKILSGCTEHQKLLVRIRLRNVRQKFVLYFCLKISGSHLEEVICQ